MDIKHRILRWQRLAEDNSGMVILIVILAIALLFITGIFVDAYLKQRRRKRRRRHSTESDTSDS